MDEARKVLAAASKRNGKEVAEDKIGTTFRAKTILRAKATFYCFNFAVLSLQRRNCYI